MRVRRHPLGAIAAAATALTLAGCAAGSPQTDASAFVKEHGAAAARVATATSAVELALSRLSSPPTRSQLGQLARSVRQARSELARAHTWTVAGSGEEGAEEEDVPRAETQVTEGAAEMLGAISAVQAYASALSAGAVARYRSKLADGRTQWNEGIAQLWYLAHRSRPPTV